MLDGEDKMKQEQTEKGLAKKVWDIGKWFIPWSGIYYGDKEEDKNVGKAVLNVFYSTVLTMALVIPHGERRQLKEAAQRIGFQEAYNNSKDFKYKSDNLNNDPIIDYVFTSKDGREIEFISDFRGYKRRDIVSRE